MNIFVLLSQARLYKCAGCRLQNTTGNPAANIFSEITSFRQRSITTLDLNADDLHEFTIPTCSYRMGVPMMGYGAAVIGKYYRDNVSCFNAQYVSHKKGPITLPNLDRFLDTLILFATTLYRCNLHAFFQSSKGAIFLLSVPKNDKFGDERNVISNKMRILHYCL